MTRPTPICPRTIGPNVPLRVTRHDLDGSTETRFLKPATRPCLGSACAACCCAPRPDGMDMDVFRSMNLVYCCDVEQSRFYPWPDPAAERPAPEPAPEDGDCRTCGHDKLHSTFHECLALPRNLPISDWIDREDVGIEPRMLICTRLPGAPPCPGWKRRDNNTEKENERDR